MFIPSLICWKLPPFFKAGRPDTDRKHVSQTADNGRTEAARLEALLAYGILDTPPEQAFDDLIELAAGVCYTPVAAVVFVDGHRAWLKAKRGVEMSEFPRDAALASESLNHADVFAVRDALADERYHDSEVVKRGFRFFAGMPLVSPERHALGAVCVVDKRPRELSSTQKDALRAIARQVMNQLELRRVSRAESLARHKFSWLVEQLPGGVYTEDLGASSGSYFSPQVERITSYSPEEWAAGDEFFGRVLHPDDRDRVLGAFARAHETLEPIQIEYRVIAKDGHVVWIQDDAAVARDDNGKPVYFQGFMADATVRKQNELKLREIEDRQLERERAQNERLRSVDRMKDEFVALVSHELRTPLTSIRGYLELVMDDAAQLPAETRGYLEIVGRNADRLLHLVGDLLLVAQAEAGKLTFDWVAVELVPLVTECVRAAQPAADAAGVELRFTSERSEQISGDPARIAQLLDNLISNAIKFTPVGGYVDVLVDASARSAVIEVRDTGYGIAAEDQEQLFQRFFRTQSANDKAIAGTGLGLSIAKAIVDAHQGSIRVESAEHHGTTFRVELPAKRSSRDRSPSRDSEVVVNLGV
jgi:PAS domain S-box-containing protein